MTMRSMLAVNRIVLPIYEKSVNDTLISTMLAYGGGLVRDGNYSIASGSKLPEGYRIRITDDETSPDRGSPMLEQSLLIEVSNPRDRLTYCRPVDIYNMVGLFFYLLRGSRSLNDIEFYNPQARRFTDEETSNRELRANWGERIFASGALARVIQLLRVSPYSRRAYLPVFLPEDIGFPSRNLPCLAGIQFSNTVSESKLDMFVTMRSQSAVGVLPYDLFLLTMLHEYVAMRADATMGTYVHFAPVCGIREREAQLFEQIGNSPRDNSMPMKKMPELSAGEKSMLLDAEKFIRERNEKAGEALRGKLPLYWAALLDVTKARRLEKDGNPDWEHLLDGATDAFPYDFLRRSIDAIHYRLGHPQ